jgi:hypothetical protein
MVCGMSARITLAIAIALPRLAHAEHVDVEQPNTVELAAQSAFTPTIASADTTGRGIAVASTTYNAATKATTLDVAAALRLSGPLQLVLRVDNVTDQGRPGIGAAYQWLSERKHGVSSTAYLVYKAEGFSEPEGEIEALVSFGRNLGPVRGVVNVAYGQDADAKERDGELALHVSTALSSRVIAGVVGRYRDALGSGGDHGVIRDAFGGLSMTVVAGPIGITGMAGIAGVETTASGALTTGPAATIAVGTGF